MKRRGGKRRMEQKKTTDVESNNKNDGIRVTIFPRKGICGDTLYSVSSCCSSSWGIVASAGLLKRRCSVARMSGAPLPSVLGEELR